VEPQVGERGPYEPEQFSEEEASIYQLGIALGANQGFTFGG
jgi:hypothetical protein